MNDTIHIPDFLPVADTASWSVAEAVLDTAADYSLMPVVYVRPEPEATETAPAWTEGLEPEPRQPLTGQSGTFVFVLVGLMVLVLFSFGSLRRILRFSFDELINIRKGRDNVFDEKPAAVSAVQLLVTVLLIVCGGFLLYVGMGGPASAAPAGLTMVTGCVAAYYLFELCGYSAVGFTFASREGRREWLRGFTASMTLLGVGVCVPALAALFYPMSALKMAELAFIMFVLAKIAFILKGFRIFFDNFFSLLYFILYLCTLEIIPIILVYRGSVDILI